MTTPSTTAPGEEPPPPATSSEAGRPGRLLTIDNRYLAPALITAILLAGQLSFGILESYTRTALAIVVSIAAEIVLSRLLMGKWPHLASAYITGISVGILIRSPAFWPYALCSLISITSKYALRWKGRHLWNPSNFGICVLLFLAPESVAALSVHWGNNAWAMIVIWILGAAIIWRVRRFHICAAYVLSFLAFSFVRSAVAGAPLLAEVAPITGPMYQLFVFFMITDPRTTVSTKNGQIAVAVAVAFVEMLLRFERIVHAPFYALFLVGPAALAFELWWKSRKASAV